VGISFDSKKALIGFKEKFRIPFNFLSDKNRVAGKKYGVNNFLFASRKTFLIDEKGILIHIIENVNLNSHPMDILELFEKVKTGD
jgi:peroxiredoxin Q/BCP